MKPSRSRWRRECVALLGATALMTGACGNKTGDDDAPTRSATADSSAFPITIDSALGSATIEASPQRVVTLGWGSEDAALALGVVPVGVQDIQPGSGDGLLPWSRARLEELDPGAEPTFLSPEVSFEQIAGLEPDVILAVHSGLSQEQFDTLSSIAPTVAYPERSWATSWEDQISTVGKALGRNAQAAELIESTQRVIADAKDAHPEFAGKTAAFGSATETGSYNFYFDTEPRTKLLQALGFTVDRLAQQLREANDETAFSAPVSMEILPMYNPDVLVAWYLSADFQNEVENNPLFASMGAVVDNSYVPITDPSLVFASSSPNVLNMSWLLEQLLPRLSAAAKNVTT